MNLNEELESFSKLIRVLEDALERAAEILSPNETPPSRSRHTIEDTAQVYENLSDLLDLTRAGRMRLLERQAR
jgi:hypothetical protein